MRFYLLLLFLLLSPVSLFGSEKLSDRLEAREGETCLVCNGPVHKGDSAYLANGQRVALHAADCCEGEFLRKPAQFMAKTRPNDILFSGTANVGISGTWLWAVVYVLLGLGMGGLCSHTAVQKGRSPLCWFFGGFFCSIPAFVYLCTRRASELATAVPSGLGKVPLTRDPVPCPGCGYDNHPSAQRCSDCGAKLEPKSRSEVSAVRRS